LNQKSFITRNARWLTVFLGCAGSAAAVAQTNSVVTVDTNLALVINGGPVFPIGFSPGPPNNQFTDSAASNYVQRFTPVP